MASYEPADPDGFGEWVAGLLTNYQTVMDHFEKMEVPDDDPAAVYAKIRWTHLLGAATAWQQLSPDRRFAEYGEYLRVSADSGAAAFVSHRDREDAVPEHRELARINMEAACTILAKYLGLGTDWATVANNCQNWEKLSRVAAELRNHTGQTRGN
jgi:hypothetical protein